MLSASAGPGRPHPLARLDFFDAGRTLVAQYAAAYSLDSAAPSIWSAYSSGIFRAFADGQREKQRDESMMVRADPELRH
jgi:hypothetical protein